MSFEAQCDCELDSPGELSHLPVEERLKHWTAWALELKGRIETHYRPRIAELEAEVARLKEHPETILNCVTCQKIAVKEHGEMEAERDALYAQVREYGAANGRLKDELDNYETKHGWVSGRDANPLCPACAALAEEGS